MRVLELFAGTRSIGKAFEAHGHQVFSVEWDKSFENIDLYEDVMKVTPEEIVKRFGRPDVIWASPDCTTYSIAAISHHRKRGGGAELGRCFRVRAVLRPREPSRSQPDYGPVAYLVVHREPARRYAEDGLHVRPSAAHRYILPVRRHPHEADGHLDEPPRPRVQTTMSQRRPVPHPSAARREDGDPGPFRKPRTVDHSGGLVRTHRRDMRERRP